MKRIVREHLWQVACIAGLVAIALAIGIYILDNQRLRFPWDEEPIRVRAAFATAQAVTPGQGQTVRVAGVRIGDVAEVSLEEGRAIIGLDIDREYEGLVRRDATALLRPRTGLKDMFIELDPGSREGRVLREHETIPVERTAPDVDPDEILSALDRDTRDYLTLLVNGLGGGFRGRGGDLREVFARLAPLHRDTRRLNVAVAERRRNLARLVHNYGSTVDTLGEKDRELSQLVSQSSQVFESLAREDDNISLAVQRLPGTLEQAQRTLTRVQELGEVMPPALRELRPAVRQLDATNEQVRPFALEAMPILRDRIRPFAREAQPYLATVRPAARNLRKASPDLRESFYELNRFFNMLAYNPNGREKLTGDFNKDRQREEGYLFWAAWTAQNGTSIFSTGDASGPLRRIIFQATCSAYLSLVQEEPAREIVLGVSDVLSDPGICPKG